MKNRYRSSRNTWDEKIVRVESHRCTKCSSLRTRAIRRSDDKVVRSTISGYKDNCKPHDWESFD